MSSEFERFINERNDVLRTLDVRRARALLPTASSDAVIIMALHKARYECTEIERDLRLQSRDWLRERGLSRQNGLPLLPHDWLPGDNPKAERFFYALSKGARIA